jgi:SAM-dependent methyltransferase
MPGFEIGPDDTVVDIGCGEGACCQYAGMKGAAVIGIDVDPLQVEKANAAMQHIPARSWKAIVDVCDPIPLPDASASVVICTEVMEHVEDPSKFAAELVRIGKPGAQYLISVPEPFSEELMRRVAPAWYWEPPYHRHVFEHEQLDAILKEAGLKIERRDACGSYFSCRWLLWMGVLKGSYAHDEAQGLMKLWDDVWGKFMASPDAALIARGLDRTLPKSQLVLATKPGGKRRDRIRRELLNAFLWKRRLRQGAVRLGGLKLTWNLHAAH